jgi:hypothetical protein
MPICCANGLVSISWSANGPTADLQGSVGTFHWGQQTERRNRDARRAQQKRALAGKAEARLDRGIMIFVFVHSAWRVADGFVDLLKGSQVCFYNDAGEGMNA